MIAAYEPLMRNWRWGPEVPHFTCRVCGFQTVPYPNGMDIYRQRLQSLVTGFEGWIKATKSQCSTGIFSGYIKVWHLATKSSKTICAKRSYTPTDAIPLSLNSCLSALVSNFSWATHAKPSQWEQKQYPLKKHTHANASRSFPGFHESTEYRQQCPSSTTIRSISVYEPWNSFSATTAWVCMAENRILITNIENTFIHSWHEKDTLLTR